MAAAGLMVALLLAACDTGPGPEPLNVQPPTVANLTVAPDTVRVADLPANQVSNGQAIVDLALGVDARDADGTVDRVLVIIEPAYGPTVPGITRLDPVDGVRYEGRRGYSVSTDQADVFTIRALAIDNDSLTSNEVISRFRLIPADPN
jgi:hypothetical protein